METCKGKQWSRFENGCFFLHDAPRSLLYSKSRDYRRRLTLTYVSRQQPHFSFELKGGFVMSKCWCRAAVDTDILCAQKTVFVTVKKYIILRNRSWDDNMSACKVAELFQIQKITSRHAAARSQSNECHQEIDFQNHIYFTSSDKAK